MGAMEVQVALAQPLEVFRPSTIWVTEKKRPVAAAVPAEFESGFPSARPLHPTGWSRLQQQLAS